MSETDVTALRQRGQGNDCQPPTSRSHLRIVQQNAFTFINVVLFATSIVLVGMGRVDDALATTALVLINAVVGVVQEVRAKRTLDRIALLTRLKATVIWEGQERTIDLVLDRS